MAAPRHDDFAILERVRRSLRSLNAAIGRGAAAAGLTLQQQAFLLAVAAEGGDVVPLASIRRELDMDRATASVLLQRLVAMRLVSRSAAEDRRASTVSLTTRGRSVFRRSVTSIRRELLKAQRRGELGPLRDDLDDYFTYYLRRPAHAVTVSAKARPRRPSALRG